MDEESSSIVLNNFFLREQGERNEVAFSIWTPALYIVYQSLYFRCLEKERRLDDLSLVKRPLFVKSVLWPLDQHVSRHFPSACCSNINFETEIKKLLTLFHESCPNCLYTKHSCHFDDIPKYNTLRRHEHFQAVANCLCWRNSQLPGYPLSKYPRKQALIQNKEIKAWTYWL